jgi:hypothetical protein
MVSIQHLDAQNASSLYFGEGDEPIFAVDYVCQGVIHRSHAATSDPDVAARWFDWPWQEPDTGSE